MSFCGPRWAISAHHFRFRDRVWVMVGLLRRDLGPRWRRGVDLRHRADVLCRGQYRGHVERDRRRQTFHGQTHTHWIVAGDRPGSRGLVAVLDRSRVVASLIAYGVLAGPLDATMNAEGARISAVSAYRFSWGCMAARLPAEPRTRSALISTSAAPWALALIGETALAGAALFVALTVAPDAGDKVGGPLAVPSRVLSRSLVVLGLTVGVSIACKSATISGRRCCCGGKPRNGRHSPARLA